MGKRKHCSKDPELEGGATCREVSRRTFLRTAATAVASAAGLVFFGSAVSAQAKNAHPAEARNVPGERVPIPSRALGKTGLEVSILGLGGAVAVAESPDRAEAIISRAIDLGINYIDTAHQYGPSEANIGRVMRRRRGEVILASKTDDRTYDGTMRQFEESLRRLQTDYLDLYQLHAMHSEGDLDAALGKGGAVEAIEKLREEGVVRHVGITAHKNSRFLASALRRYPFDCVLLSLNAGDVHHDSMIENALPVANEREMGVIAMKVCAYDGRIFRDDGLSTMREALGYTLSHPVSTAIVGISTLAELEENARIAREFRPFPPEELRRLEGLTRAYAGEANFFKHRW
ncbi:MAG: aldo/keto reductase [Spirochaetaceae bacterium]